MHQSVRKRFFQPALTDFSWLVRLCIVQYIFPLAAGPQAPGGFFGSWFES
jgi:hypothetical protein